MTNTLKSILVAAGAMLAAQAASPAQEDAATNGPALDTVRQTLRTWFETQKAISKEKSDWEVGNDLLEQRIALLEGGIAGVEEKIAQARQGGSPRRTRSAPRWCARGTSSGRPRRRSTA